MLFIICQTWSKQVEMRHLNKIKTLKFNKSNYVVSLHGSKLAIVSFLCGSDKTLQPSTLHNQRGIMPLPINGPTPQIRIVNSLLKQEQETKYWQQPSNVTLTKHSIHISFPYHPPTCDWHPDCAKH